MKKIRHVCVRGISQVASLKQRVEKERGLSGAVSFVAISLAIFFKRKKTSYWCEEFRKLLCVVPCFKIYHTERDFKKHGQFIREGIMAMEGVDNSD